MKKLLKEFKEFSIKGNVMDLAVAVLIGAAFSAIVNSAVKDIAMPIIGMLTGGVDFSTWTIALPNLFNQADPVPLSIGNFINSVVSFVIIALVIFAFIKLVNAFKKKKEVEPAAPPAPSNEEKLLAEIRDLLKEQRDK